MSLKTDDPELLVDLFEALLRAEEILEKHAIFDQDEEGRGKCNAEGALLTEIQDNPDGYYRGLLSRLKDVLKKDVLG